MEYERIRGIADMINAVVQYIVECAVDRRAQMMSYEWRLRGLRDGADRDGADAPVEIHALTDAEGAAGGGSAEKAAWSIPRSCTLKSTCTR